MSLKEDIENVEKKLYECIEKECGGGIPYPLEVPPKCKKYEIQLRALLERYKLQEGKK